MSTDLTTTENALAVTDASITILPGAIPDSHIPGFKCRSWAKPMPVLFIGGVLDGQILRVPPDGRLYDHHTDWAGERGENETYRYVPAVISLKGRVTGVYLLEERIGQAERTAIENEQGPKRIDGARRITGEIPVRRITKGESDV